MRSLALVFIVGSLAALPQDPSREAGMLRTAQQLAVTTAEHQLLQRLVGEWDVVSTTFPPGGKPQEARGRMVGKSMLGGRYVVLNHSIAVSGSKIEAVQLLGFDTLRGHYTSSWRDDVSTWAVECSGAAVDGEPQQWVLRGTLADARTPAGRTFRCTFDLRDAKSIKVELFDAHEGEEVRVQTQTWTAR
jgi:hypothetical protein